MDTAEERPDSNPLARRPPQRGGAPATQPTDGPRTAVWATLYAIAVPGSLMVLVPLLLLAPQGAWADRPMTWYRILGVVPILLGVLVVCWCTRDFVLRGRGTPAPNAPPRFLVIGGPYRWSRNPMYVAILCHLAGVALLTWSRMIAFYALGTWLSMQLFLVLYEEPSLVRRFGAAYERYRLAVPRWLGRRRHITDP